ncbi:MAG: septum formation initiator family protein [Acidobacteriota bacterium]
MPAAGLSPRERYRKWQRRIATVVLSTLALVMAYGVVFGHDGLTAYAHKRGQEHSLQQQLDELQKENDRLSVHVEQLQSDPDAIARTAHQELHYTRPGEVIYSISPKPVASDATPTASHP